MSTASTPQQLAGPQTYAIGSPIGAAGSTEPEGMNLGDVMRILKQRKLTIIITSIVLYILVVVATVLVGMYAPAYTSEALFELDPPHMGNMLDLAQAEVNTDYMEQLLRTEAQKLCSIGLMMDVVALPAFKATRYYDWYDNKADEAAVGLQEDLSIAPVTDTQLIRIALSCRDKVEARLIVQQVVEKYQSQFQDAAAQELLDHIEGLGNTLDKLEGELAAKRNELRSLRESGNIPAAELRRLEARDHVVFLRNQISDIDAAVTALQAQANSLNAVDPQRIPLTAEQQLIVESDPILRFWRSQAENLAIEITAQMQHFGPNHRSIDVLYLRLEGYRTRETTKREELITQVRERQIESLNQQLAQTKSVQNRLLEQFDKVQIEERELDRALLLYAEMQADELRLADQIAEVQGKLTEAGHAMNDRTRQRLHLRQAPVEAVKPSRPNYPIYLAGGFILALAGGFGLAFLRELTDQVVRTPIDVARFGRLSVLGCIPQLDDEEAEEVEEIEEAVLKAPHSLIAETFRRTRTNLQFSGPEESQRCLLITSPGPGDGKTAIAINLAATMAHAGSRVLLIDCNFRRPAIRGQFTGTRPEGLSNLLIGQGKLEDYVTHTDLKTLDVLASGPMPPTPAELLGSPQMRALLAETRERYDRVILDGPPALLISDAGVLAMQVDGVILVARAEENSRGALKRARDQLDAINARTIGAIVNGVKTRAGGYFKAQYREFYDYVSDETVPVELPQPAQADDSSADDEDE